MSNKRIWTPAIGQKVSMATFNHYCAAGIANWHWMTVQAIDGDGDTATATATVQNVNTLEVATVPVRLIQAPIGWHENYTITTTRDNICQVLAWLADGRGITVRQSSYMPTCPTAFQPSDNDDIPGWQFAGYTIVEKIHPSQCDELIAVALSETQYDVGVPVPCQYCDHGKRTPERNPVLIGRDTERCLYCGAIAGYSFTEPHHPKGYRYGYVEGIKPDDSQCAIAGSGWSRYYLTLENAQKAFARLQDRGYVASVISHPVNPRGMNYAVLVSRYI